MLYWKLTKRAVVFWKSFQLEHDLGRLLCLMCLKKPVLGEDMCWFVASHDTMPWSIVATLLEFYVYFVTIKHCITQ